MKVLGTYLARELWRYSTALFNSKVLILGDTSVEGSFVQYFSKMFTQFNLSGLSFVSERNPQLSLFSADNKDVVGMFNGRTWSISSVVTSGTVFSPIVEELIDKVDIVIGFPDVDFSEQTLSYLLRHNKQFIILGDIKCVFNPDVFKAFQLGIVSTGFTLHTEHLDVIPGDSDIHGRVTKSKLLSGDVVAHLRSYRWFTNTGLSSFKMPYSFYRTIPIDSPVMFDNTDAYNFPDFRTIPDKFPGVIGTSPVFLDYMRSSEFQLLYSHRDITGGLYVGGKESTYRIFVKML